MTIITKPHAICISFPAQSHMKGIMKLAKPLQSRGFYITFVNTEFNQNRLIKSKGSDIFESFDDFKFETIPDGLPPSNANATQDVPALCRTVRRKFSKPFLELVAKLNDKKCSTSPPVTCIVGDGLTPFVITAGKELGIPVALYWTFSACGFWGFFQYRALLEKGFTPLKDLTRVFEEGEHHGSNKVPDSETTQKKREEQIGFGVESMEAMKSKIEALEEENAKLREKLDVACAKLEVFENARLACYEALSKVNHTDALWTSSDL